MSKPKLESRFTRVNDRNIHYLEVGRGDPILFIHGFPTSSFLWRNILFGLSDNFKVIAIDLPGYGQSDKRIEDSYSFRYYSRILSGFMDNLNIDQVTLGVHDVGGPIGLYWMVQNMERVNRLILFNTLVYPKFSWAVKLFGLATITPGIRNWITSPNGIKRAIFFGVFNKNGLSDDIIKAYQEPFTEKSARKVLLKSVQRLSMKGFKEIEEKLSSFNGPVVAIYGQNDKILPRVGDTMERVKKDLPQTVIIRFPDCGHFLQEDASEEICEAILDFVKD